MTPARPSLKSRSWSRWRAIAANLAVAGALLFSLSFLPPDNSLSDIQKSGMLRVCVPQSVPPLVTTNPDMPGYDIELLEHVAAELGVRLTTNTNPAIGSDFNVRNWRLTRAQCAIVAGGVVDDASTRGFLQVLSTGAMNGWAQLTVKGTVLKSGDRVGVFPSASTLDRLQLSRHLREIGAETVRFPNINAMLDALTSGEVTSVVADYLTIATVDRPQDVELNWLLPQDQGQFMLGFGLWKGDSTLFRAVQESLLRLERDGTIGALAERYGLDAALPN